MSYEDQTLTCRDCGREFVFTAGEQEFYAQKGFVHDPLRCPDCRRARKQGGNKQRSGKVQNSRRSRVQHEVQCAMCGKVTTVPFVPRGDKPVYCFDCLQKKRQDM